MPPYLGSNFCLAAGVFHFDLKPVPRIGHRHHHGVTAADTLLRDAQAITAIDEPDRIVDRAIAGCWHEAPGEVDDIKTKSDCLALFRQRVTEAGLLGPPERPPLPWGFIKRAAVGRVAWLSFRNIVLNGVEMMRAPRMSREDTLAYYPSYPVSDAMSPEFEKGTGVVAAVGFLDVHAALGHRNSTVAAAHWLSPPATVRAIREREAGRLDPFRIATIECVIWQSLRRSFCRFRLEKRTCSNRWMPC